MSESEHGLYRLPRDQAAAIKEAIRVAANELHDHVLDMCRHAHREATAAYRREFMLWPGNAQWSDVSTFLATNKVIPQPESGEIEQFFPRATLRTDQLRYALFTIRFLSAQDLEWCVPTASSNNFALIRNETMARTVFEQLHSADWGQKTGGYVVRQTGKVSRIVDALGPIGFAAREAEVSKRSA